MKKLLILIVSIICIFVTGCSSWRSSASKWLPTPENWIPGVYKIDIQQGNIVSQENINRVKPGMTQRQVRFLMGTPLIKDGFHQNRWDYIYTLRPGGEKTQKQLVTLYFEDKKVVKIEGDLYPQTVPGELASLNKRTIVTIDPKPKKRNWLVKMLGMIGLSDE